MIANLYMSTLNKVQNVLTNNEKLTLNKDIALFLTGILSGGIFGIEISMMSMSYAIDLIHSDFSDKGYVPIIQLVIVYISMLLNKLSIRCFACVELGFLISLNKRRNLNGIELILGTNALNILWTKSMISASIILIIRLSNICTQYMESNMNETCTDSCVLQCCEVDNNNNECTENICEIGNNNSNNECTENNSEISDNSSLESDIAQENVVFLKKRNKK